jgi:hypothetical protein
MSLRLMEQQQWRGIPFTVVLAPGRMDRRLSAGILREAMHAIVLNPNPDVRIGSKRVKLRTSICLPGCLR